MLCYSLGRASRTVMHRDRESSGRSRDREHLVSTGGLLMKRATLMLATLALLLGSGIPAQAGTVTYDTRNAFKRPLPASQRPSKAGMGLRRERLSPTERASMGSFTIPALEMPLSPMHFFP
jgi:hypothetical protein